MRKLNCRPGDLAIVVEAFNPVNIGNIVNVLSKHRDQMALVCPDDDVIWLVQAAHPMTYELRGKITRRDKGARSGSTNLNSEISGNSGDNALTTMVRQTGVFHGQAEEEGRRCQTCTQAAHRRIQSAGGTCRVARGQNNGAVVSGV
jgi:hypothetical protein